MFVDNFAAVMHVVSEDTFLRAFFEAFTSELLENLKKMFPHY